MRKNAIIIAVAMLIFASIPSAFGLENISTKSDNVYEEIEYQVINIDETTIQITINPGKFEFGSIITEEGMFATINVPNFAFSSTGVTFSSSLLVINFPGPWFTPLLSLFKVLVTL